MHNYIMLVVYQIVLCGILVVCPFLGNMYIDQML